jgi:predicted P-loop ATPase
MVARVDKPGCYADNMIVLEGKQGRGKSTSLEAIGGKYFTNSNGLVGTKDFVQQMQGRMVVEIGELDSFNRAENNKIKNFLSIKTDHVRMPYEAKNRPHPRTCIFVGTTNDNEYLTDPSGARRFWPIKTNKISLLSIKRDRDQLFAEAFHKYDQGENWWETPDSAEDEQNIRQESDLWQEIIYNWLRKYNKTETNSVEILKDAINMDIDKMHNGHKTKVAKCMRAIGWHQAIVRKGRRTLRVYKPDDDFAYDGSQDEMDISSLPNFAPTH